MKLSRIPMYYNLRNLWLRRTSTAITASAIGMVVLVIELMLTLVASVNRTFVPTGRADNFVVTSRQADSEIVSQVSLQQTKLIAVLPGVGLGASGRPLVSPELMNQFTFEQINGQLQDVVIRGVESQAFAVHPEVRISDRTVAMIDGDSALVGSAVAATFKGMQTGSTIMVNQRRFAVRGIMASGGTSFESEIWISAEKLQAILKSAVYSSIRIRVVPGELAEVLRKRIENDPRLQLRVERESDFYAREFSGAADVRTVVAVGALLASPAAALAVMITMYGTIGARAKEIGTMRALGFSPGSVQMSFLLEAGMLGAIAALLVEPIVPNFVYLSYSGGAGAGLRTVVVNFAPTPAILFAGPLVSVALAMVGGFLPARWASRLTVNEALAKL